MPGIYVPVGNQNNYDEVEKPSSTSTTLSPTKILIYAVIAGVTIYAATIWLPDMFTTDTATESGTSYVEFSHHRSTTKDNIKKADSDTDISSFSLKRVGYDALTYFNPDESTFLSYVFLEDYSAIIEPSAPMELTFYDFDSLTDDSVSYEYIVCPNDDTTQSCQQGSMYYDTTSGSTVTSTVTFSCTPQSAYTLSVFEVSNEGEILNTATVQAMCLYVRREIRSLTTDDLNSFLDASYTLNNVTQTQGELLYGSNYYSAATLTKLHFYNAAQRDSDHIHEGNGFLLQHLKLQNYFENSIQSVNNIVSLPYWDFTIDHSEDLNGFDSFLSSPDLYGTVSYPTGDLQGFTKPDNIVEDGRIADSRWEGLLADINDVFPDLYAGYGYMRAAWSFNPSPYVSRYSFDWNFQQSTLPSCSQHYEIASMTDIMMNFFYDMSFAPHASGHTVYGGVFGCDEVSDWITIGLIKNTSMQQKVCTALMANMKVLYRLGVIEVEKDCVVDSNDYTSSSCNFLCRDEITTQLATIDLYASLYMDLDLETVPMEQAMDILAEFICRTDGGLSKMYMGEHYESASPADPSFWVMHPTLERLAHARFLSGGFNDETWTSDPVNDFVCMFSSCYHEDTDTTDYYDDCCYGHFEESQLYDGLTGSRSSYLGPTNSEVLSAIDPRLTSYSMNYIYDSFDWDHCIESGYDFAAMLEESYEEYLEVNGLTEALEIVRKQREKKGKAVVTDKKTKKSKSSSSKKTEKKTEKTLKDVKRYAEKKTKKSHSDKKVSRRPYEDEVENRRKAMVKKQQQRYQEAKELEKKRQAKGYTREKWLAQYEESKKHKNAKKTSHSRNKKIVTTPKSKSNNKQ